MLVVCLSLFAAVAIFTAAFALQGGSLSLCLTRTGIVAQAALLYAGDNNDRLPISLDDNGPCNRRRYFATVVKPYHSDWHNYRCPEDANANIALAQNECGSSRRRDDILVNWALKSHRGYNWLMLAPMVTMSGQPPMSYPIELSEVADPKKTLMIIESIWDRNPNGSPRGGGNFAVDAPCIRDVNNSLLVPFPPGGTGYYWLGGWDPDSLAWNEFGGAWHWHKANLFVIGMLDGSAQAINIDQLTAGCDVREAGQGRAYDLSAYIWDTRQ